MLTTLTISNLVRKRYPLHYSSSRRWFACYFYELDLSGKLILSRRIGLISTRISQRHMRSSSKFNFKPKSAPNNNSSSSSESNIKSWKSRLEELKEDRNNDSNTKLAAGVTEVLPSSSVKSDSFSDQSSKSNESNFINKLNTNANKFKAWEPKSQAVKAAITDIDGQFSSTNPTSRSSNPTGKQSNSWLEKLQGLVPGSTDVKSKGRGKNVRDELSPKQPTSPSTSETSSGQRSIRPQPKNMPSELKSSSANGRSSWLPRTSQQTNGSSPSWKPVMQQLKNIASKNSATNLKDKFSFAVPNRDELNLGTVKSTSVRGSKRLVQEQQSERVINSKNKGFIEGDLQSVSKEVLRDLQSNRDGLNDDSDNLRQLKMGSASAIMEETEELTEGEQRYLQHQEHLRRKKNAFDLKYNPLASRYDRQRASTSASPNAEPQVESEISVSEMKRLTAVQVQLQKQQLMRKDLTAKIPRKKPNKEMKTKLQMKYVRKRVTSVPKSARNVSIPAVGIYIKELSSRMAIPALQLHKKLVEFGELESLAPVKKTRKFMRRRKMQRLDDHFLDIDVAELVALEMGFNPVREVDTFVDVYAQSPSAAAVGQTETIENDSSTPMIPRAPIICIMGHVDHGKTTLLDYLRPGKDSIASSEAGGITQRLSAFKLAVNDRSVVFLDTPGHAAFTSMRANGASATDVVVLVVAVDDGVRPQTIEAIKIAKSAGCKIIVALNKMDKVGRDETDRKNARNRVLTQLTEHELIAEDFGGDVMCFNVSGKTGDGIPALLEGLALQTDVMELKAPDEGQAEAIVLDANLERGRGSVADILVRWGRLSVGDTVVVGTTFGKVKGMYDAEGKTLKTVGPSTPVRLFGLRDVPVAGQELISVSDETKAKLITDRRIRLDELKRLRQQEKHKKPPKDAELEEEIEVPKITEVSLILKADGVGTLSALKKITDGLANQCEDVVSVRIVDASVGNITSTDVDNAFTASKNGSNPAILAFNVNLADSQTRSLANEIDVPILKSNIIYRIEDELKEIIESVAPKEKIYVKEGSAVIRQVFQLNDKKDTRVAGLIVSQGKMKTSVVQKKGNFKRQNIQYTFNILRGQKLLVENISKATLKKFKDDVNEIDEGNECGLSFDEPYDFQEGDIVECIRTDYRTPIIWSGEK